MKQTLLKVLMVVLFFSSTANAKCKSVSYDEFLTIQKTYKSKTLRGIASWCSSCKESLKLAQSDSEKYVFIVAFDGPQNVEKVLEHYQVKSDCFAGDELVEKLKIDRLPWESYGLN